MERREAIRKIGFTTGLVLAAPSIVSLLQSCASDVKNWTPVFLSEDQGLILRKMVDVILPKTDTPSASEVNVPEFIDKYFNEIMDISDQERIKIAFHDLAILIQTDYNKNLAKVSEENYKDLLDNHLLLHQEKSSETEPMSISELLNTIKWMTINAYRISETVGETILAYDPIPGAYYCGDLQELTGGKAWSL